MKKIITIIAIIAAIGLGFYLHSTPSKKVGDIIASPLFTATNSSITCGPSSANTVAIATSTSRFFLRISNTSGGGVYLGLGKAATSTQGLTVFAGTGYEFSQSNLFDGAIYCYSASTTTLPTVEY